MGRIIKFKETVEDICIAGVYHQITLVIEGTVYPGRAARMPSPSCETGSPPEPREIEDFYCGMKKLSYKEGENPYVDFEPFMSKQQIEACHEKLFERYEDGE